MISTLQVKISALTILSYGRDLLSEASRWNNRTGRSQDETGNPVSPYSQIASSWSSASAVLRVASDLTRDSQPGDGVKAQIEKAILLLSNGVGSVSGGETTNIRTFEKFCSHYEILSVWDQAILCEARYGRGSDAMLGCRVQPTNKEDADRGNLNAVRHVAYAEGFREGKSWAEGSANEVPDAVTHYGTVEEVPPIRSGGRLSTGVHTPLLLTKGQATAAYQSMVLLNEVGGTIKCGFPSGRMGRPGYKFLTVEEMKSGNIAIRSSSDPDYVESHSSQDSFCRIYGL